MRSFWRVAVLALGHLAHALAGGVVDIVGRLRRRPVSTTCCSWSLKSRSPICMRQVRHAQSCCRGRRRRRLSASIERRCPPVVLRQAVALLAGSSQAVFVVGVAARPARLAGSVPMAASPGSCRRRRRRSARCSCPWRCRRWDAAGRSRERDSRVGRCRAESSRSPVWPEVLAAGGLDQPVEGVVGVLGARLDALVAEVDGLLGVVADVGDVARRVVGVAQVLHLTAGSEAAAGSRSGRRGVRVSRWVRRKVSGS